MPRTSYPPERRAFGRRETLVHAIARIPGRAPEPCIVKDLSDGGALLEFPIPVHPNGPFRLCVEAKGIDVHCEVRRQQDRQIGVRFLDGEAAGAFADAPAPERISLLQEVIAPRAPSLTDRPVTLVDASDVRLRMFGVKGV